MAQRSLEDAGTVTTYSLLQASLNQRIDRCDLEQASVAVPSVARADCAMLARGMFGILVSGLPADEAQAFQRSLERYDYPTTLVADHELPLLHDSYQVRRVDMREDGLVFTNSMGKALARPTQDWVFMAGGFVGRTETKVKWEQRLDFSQRPYSGMPMLVNERKREQVEATGFRLDFFFHTAPHRVHLQLEDHSVIFHQGRQLKLRDEGSLRLVSVSLAQRLPPQRWNQFLQDPDGFPDYPSLDAYEEELQWHFYHLLKG